MSKEGKPEGGFDDVGNGGDPVGNMETRKIQQMERVDIPEEYIKHLGLSKGDRVVVVCKEDRIVIIEQDIEKIKDI